MSDKNYKVRLIANVKLGNQRHSRGDYIELNSDDYSKFKESKLINDEFTKEVEEVIKTVDEMTVPELKEYAEANGVDLTGKKTKDDILEAISTKEDKNKSGDE